jgi:hypothetical protein
MSYMGHRKLPLPDMGECLAEGTVRYTHHRANNLAAITPLDLVNLVHST